MDSTRYRRWRDPVYQAMLVAQVELKRLAGLGAPVHRSVIDRLDSARRAHLRAKRTDLSLFEAALEDVEIDL